MRRDQKKIVEGRKKGLTSYHTKIVMRMWRNKNRYGDVLKLNIKQEHILEF